MSKSLSSAERNYEIDDKELLLVIQGLEEWRHILEGTMHMIEILSDNRNLIYFQMSQNLNHQQTCCSLSSCPDLTSPSSTGWGDAQPSWMPSLIRQIIRPRRNKTTISKL